VRFPIAARRDPEIEARAKQRRRIDPAATRIIPPVFVLLFDDRRRRVAVLTVPERIDRQHLHVDRHRVHLLETLFDDDKMLGYAFDRREYLCGVIAHQIDGVVEKAMGVNIDRPDMPTADLDGQAGGSRPGAGRVQHAATAKTDPGRNRALQKSSAGSHGSLPDGRSIRAPACLLFLSAQIAKR
jgi:hypothetical protein